MKITLEKDDGELVVFNDITDLYLAVRQEVAISNHARMGFSLSTSSYSWGSNPREIVKEVQQSLVELQDFLREATHASRKSDSS